MNVQPSRFWEIEGLRAWLAWTVVVSHLFITLNVQDFGLGYFAPLAGAHAVSIFIMISGFVIAGLVIEQQESWPRYILRRAFRIYPAYLVALAVGAAATPLALQGLVATSWGGDPNSYYVSSLREGLASTEAHPWTHWALHLTLLQGVMPDNVLPWSSVAFVGPAWSLSLEWQFYLIAPALMWALRSPSWRAPVVIVAFACAVLFERGVFGTYSAPSTLLGGLWLFVIGMGCRLALPALKTTALPLSALALGAFGFGLLRPDLFPVAVWLAFFVLLMRPAPTGIIDRGVAAAAKVLFASPLAAALGARSYSVYIIHIPIMKLLLYALPLQAMTQWQALGCLAATALPLTLLASELLFRFVERPMIRLGQRLASTRRTAVATPSASQRATP
ncbi:MAG TPA: acyltransferase [Vitreimonas sp.]|uniref:acyltransferase family protein n=1 Tax=Vitreimonas sp. TaxID=3069702 RepID=UPI002D6B6476|nr:acyltransferase [Vitreimonas sp.]HYD86981.1 acyltransferase [Vitreimonas sp.]